MSQTWVNALALIIRLLAFGGVLGEVDSFLLHAALLAQINECGILANAGSNHMLTCNLQG